jgi:hypothetical protein
MARQPDPGRSPHQGDGRAALRRVGARQSVQLRQLGIDVEHHAGIRLPSRHRSAR